MILSTSVPAGADAFVGIPATVEDATGGAALPDESVEIVFIVQTDL
jgi:hypothetical protein